MSGKRRQAKTGKLNARRERFKAELLTGTKTQVQAALDAGYSPATAKSNASEMAAEVRSELAREFKRVGITPARVAEKLSALLDAKTVKFNPSKPTGETITKVVRGKKVQQLIVGDWDEFDDGHLQLDTVREINRLVNAYPNEDPDADVRPVQIIFPTSFTSIAIGAEQNGKDR